MALSNNGNISALDIQGEFGGENPILLSEYYANGGLVLKGTLGKRGLIPEAGAISYEHFLGSAGSLLRGASWRKIVPTYALGTTIVVAGNTLVSVAGGYVHSSTNGGLSWVRDYSTAPSGYTFLNKKPVYVNGRLWAPFSAPYSGHARVFFLYSDDLGKTWKNDMTLADSYMVVGAVDTTSFFSFTLYGETYIAYNYTDYPPPYQSSIGTYTKNVSQGTMSAVVFANAGLASINVTGDNDRIISVPTAYGNSFSIFPGIYYVAHSTNAMNWSATTYRDASGSVATLGLIGKPVAYNGSWYAAKTNGVLVKSSDGANISTLANALPNANSTVTLGVSPTYMLASYRSATSAATLAFSEDGASWSLLPSGSLGMTQAQDLVCAGNTWILYENSTSIWVAPV